jgi:hypothetical protein
MLEQTDGLTGSCRGHDGQRSERQLRADQGELAPERQATAPPGGGRAGCAGLLPV